jgi:hypothetical protein
MQLRIYRDTMAQALSFTSEEYFVSIPPYLVGDPQEPWDMTLDIEPLELLNIRTIISDYALEADDLVFEKQMGGVYIYSNPGARPRAWIEPSPGDPQHHWDTVESLHWTPNKITIQANGPGMLVLSEIAYPGWQVSVDGLRSQVQTVDGLLRGVILSPGNHEVAFAFHPVTVYVGAVISLLGAAIVVLLWVRR